MDDKLEGVKRRILALMAKTTTNGCTEQEAALASEKVKMLMLEYQLSLSDLQLQQSGFKHAEFRTNAIKSYPVERTLIGIFKFCDVKGYRSHKWEPLNGRLRPFVTYVFFGLESDVQVAQYILKICQNAIINLGEDFRKNDLYLDADKQSRSKIKEDFENGVADRLRTRLIEMANQIRAKTKASTGRDLVLVKSSIVESEFAKLNINLVDSKRRPTRANDAYHEGWDQGGAVGLNPGINQPQKHGVIK